MTDWFQTLMSGFGRVVQSTGANQSQQEQQAEDASRSGQSMSGFGGVAAALGNVAANLSSNNTEQLRPMTISGPFNEAAVPDTAFVVLQAGVHTPIGATTGVPAIVARLVPGRVYETNVGERFWADANNRYSNNVAVVYWTGTAYDFLPTIAAIPTTVTAAQRQQLVTMNQVATACRGLFRDGTAVATHLRNNATTSGHYYVDLVFTLQSGTWRPTPNPNAPITRQRLFQPGRRLNATSSVGNIYEQWDTALKVTMQWPTNAGVRLNSWVANPAGAVTVSSDTVTAFEPGDAGSGMVLQGGNFVAGLFADRNDLLTPELVAFPGFTRAASRLFTDMVNTPLHLDYDGAAPTPAPPASLVNRIAVPPAVAIDPTQAATLILSRTIRPIDRPWAPQGGTFPVGGGTLTVQLPRTTVYADGVRATTWTNPAPTVLQPNSDHYLTVTTNGVVNWIVQAAGSTAPSPGAGVVLVSQTTTDANGVTASALLLPTTMPVLTGTWIESFAINIGNLRRGEMNRVTVTITQPALGQWQVQVTLNENAAPAVPITPTQIEIA
jgi:hypothetical protein